jgi:hypothetical protein
MHSSSIGMSATHLHAQTFSFICDNRVLRLEVTKAITSLKSSFPSAAIVPLLVYERAFAYIFCLPSLCCQVLDSTMGSGTTDVSSLVLTCFGFQFSHPLTFPLSGRIGIFEVRRSTHITDKSRQLLQVRLLFKDLVHYHLVLLIYRAGFILSLAHIGICVFSQSGRFIFLHV